MSIRIIVTGGSGFIGTNIVQFYLDRNIDVVNIDITSPIHPAHVNYWISGDICNEKRLTDIFKDTAPTHVIHLAARTDLKGKTLEDYSANTQGVHNTLSAINSCRSVKKAIFASSMLVCKAGYIPNDYDDCCPTTVYGESKVISEIIIKEHTGISCSWNIVRPTSIWGPWFGEPYRNFFDLVIGGWYVNLKGKTATKTFGFVGNAVYQIDKLLFQQVGSVNRRTFYIGDKPPIDISKWADQILAELGRPPAFQAPFLLFKAAATVGDILNIFKLPFPMSSFRLKNMTTNNIVDLEDLYGVVGDPPFSLRSGIIQTLAWLKEEAERLGHAS